VTEQLRVVIAEDNYLVREGTRQLLEDSGEVRVLASVGNATELKDAAARMGPHVVITDVRMPPGQHMEGIEAAHRIRESHPQIGVVVLSQYADPAYAVELLRNGSDGLAYLVKDRVGDLDELIRAIREVAGGGSVIDSQVVEALISQRRQAEDSPLAELTPRELDVLRAMAEGKSNPGIAETLFLSESSVEKHVNSIFGKLGLAREPHVNRRVLAVLAFLRSPAVDQP
jgi:DNA-binding NarL/FixJ family response regulator